MLRRLSRWFANHALAMDFVMYHTSNRFFNHETLQKFLNDFQEAYRDLPGGSIMDYNCEETHGYTAFFLRRYFEKVYMTATAFDWIEKTYGNDGKYGRIKLDVKIDIIVFRFGTIRTKFPFSMGQVLYLNEQQKSEIEKLNIFLKPIKANFYEITCDGHSGGAVDLVDSGI